MEDTEGRGRTGKSVEEGMTAKSSRDNEEFEENSIVTERSQE